MLEKHSVPSAHGARVSGREEYLQDLAHLLLGLKEVRPLHMVCFKLGRLACAQNVSGMRFAFSILYMNIEASWLCRGPQITKKPPPKTGGGDGSSPSTAGSPSDNGTPAGVEASISVPSSERTSVQAVSHVCAVQCAQL